MIKTMPFNIRRDLVAQCSARVAQKCGGLLQVAFISNNILVVSALTTGKTVRLT